MILEGHPFVWVDIGSFTDIMTKEEVERANDG